MELTKWQINEYIDFFEDEECRKHLYELKDKGYRFKVNETPTEIGTYVFMIVDELGHEIYDDELSEIGLEKLKRVQRVVEKANKDIQNIKKDIDKFNEKGLSLQYAYHKLGGHNFDDNLFDVNYGAICATVLWKNKHLELSNSVEIWDDENGVLLDNDYRVGE